MKLFENYVELFHLLIIFLAKSFGMQFADIQSILKYETIILFSSVPNIKQSPVSGRSSGNLTQCWQKPFAHPSEHQRRPKTFSSHPYAPQIAPSPFKSPLGGICTDFLGQILHHLITVQNVALYTEEGSSVISKV